MRGLQNQQRVAIHRALVKVGGNRAMINPTLIVDILSAEDRTVLGAIISRVDGITDMDKAVKLVARTLGMAE